MASYSDIASGFPYGFGVMYALQIEGFQYLWVERNVGASNPTGYVQDASLVVEESSRIGSIVDRHSGIGKAFDLTVTLLDSTVNAATFKRPDVAAKLTADLANNETSTITGDVNTDFSSSGIVYIGQEAIGYTSKNGSTELKGLTRGSPNGDWKAYTHTTTSQVSAWVTDANLFWRGKRAKLYAIPITPYGKITGANALTDASVIWHGVISEQPVRVADGWTFNCRSFDRVLETPAITPFTGQGTFDIYDDPPVYIDKSWTWGLETWLVQSNIQYHEAEYKPFDYAWITDGEIRSLSWAREQIAYNFNAANALKTYVGMMSWVPAMQENGYLRWTAWIQVASNYGGSDYRALKMKRWNVTGSAPWLWAPHSQGSFMTTPPVPPIGAGAYEYVDLEVSMSVLPGQMASFPGIRAKFQAHEVARVPSTGWALIEGPDQKFPFKYTSKTVQGDEVLLATDGDTHEDAIPFPITTEEGARINFTVTTCSLIDDDVIDCMRHILMSSGRGNNDGTFDTLPQQSGYDLEAVDTASFSTELDGGWVGLTANMLLSNQGSFVTLFGKLLALSQRAVVPRSDGTTVKLAAVRTNVVGIAGAPATITDADLVVSRSRKQPIRPKRPRNPPNSVTVKTKSHTGDDAGSIVLQDVVAQRAAGTTKLAVETHGIDHADLLQPVTAWSQSLFGDVPSTNIVEIDVAPWVSCETGDAVDLRLSHFALWDNATGTRGYTGAARVLGRQINLKTQIQTLTLMLQGTWQNLSLAPSAQVVSWSGSAGSPGWVSIHLDYLGLMTAYLASSSPFTLTAYKPSEDGVSYGYTINGVSSAAGACRLTVASVIGTFNVSTDYYLTLPVTASSNAAQTQHMHDSDGSKWL